MAEPSTYQSLYRRYRSQRFDQVLGQDHVTKALRNAVRDGRVGHAYLFSGPRGTGKTSTARILAKVLNCAAPEDGEPCGKCDNCLTVERGQDIDWLLEQDAASKSKVDDMRDLLDRVPLGTSGNRKVIILDEVHMLSQGAENALLKTLEEPPSHVVFVLATTDPQKVRPTIRSRTQHFEFHLLTAEVLADHVRHVIADADLQLDPDAIPGVVDHVVRAGGGSARDTLSALDQVAALGEVMADTQSVDAILDAVAARDPGNVLVAVAEAVSTGREPRALGEALITRLRDAFLVTMGAGNNQLPAAEQERARQLGQQFGPAGLTRALEVLGEALTELSRKPDPRIVVEVALVRLARPDTDRSLDSLVARLDALERAVQTGAASGNPPGASDGSSSVSGSNPPGAASNSGGGGQPQPQPDASNGSEGGLEPVSGTGGEPAPRAASSRPSGGPSSGGGPASAARAVLAEKTESSSGPRAAQPPSTGQATPAAQPAQTAARGATAPTAATQEPAPAADSPGSRAPEPAQSSAPAPAGSDSGSGLPGSPDLAGLQSAWTGTVLGTLPVPVRSRWRGGRWQDVAGGTARFAVSNEWHKKACDEGRPAVERALNQHFNAALTVEVVIEGGGDADAGGPGAPARAEGPASAGGREGADGSGREPGNPTRGGTRADATPSAVGGGGPNASADAEPVNMAEIAELPDANDVTTGGVALLMREFGGELIATDHSKG